MRHSLKIQLASFVAILFIGISGLMAQDVTTVEATSQEISNHLDLEAVASIFGDSKDLEDFEKRLNDPESKISNLDLNNDNYVDYLRVVEIAEEDTHIVAIQAVLGEDMFQDVATIEIEKDNDGQTRVQVVGDVYMYGNDYIIEPVYVHRPVFFTHFWRPHYRPYCSTWYWGYYPQYYYHWSPFHVDYYYTHIYHHVNVHHVYHYTTVRRSRRASHIYHTHRRNDYGRRHIERSYVSRRDAGHRSATRGTAKTRRDLAVKRVGTAKRPTSRRTDKAVRPSTTRSNIKKGRRVGVADKARANKTVATRKPTRVSTQGGKRLAKRADVRKPANKRSTDIRSGKARKVNKRTPSTSKNRQVSTRNKTQKPSSTTSRKATTRKSQARPSTSRTTKSPSRSVQKRTTSKPRGNVSRPSTSRQTKSPSRSVQKRSTSKPSGNVSRGSSSRKSSTSSRSTSSRSSKSSGSASRNSSSKKSSSRSSGSKSSNGRKR